MAEGKSKGKPIRLGNRMSEEEIEEFLSSDSNRKRFSRRNDLEYIHDDLKPSNYVRDLAEEAVASVDKPHADEDREASERNTPPVLAELLSYATTKARLRESVLGSRRECFVSDVARIGRKQAVRIYWIDTVKSCWPFIKGLLRLALVGDVIQRWWRS